jgi:hypothetical protein
MVLKKVQAFLLTFLHCSYILISSRVYYTNIERWMLAVKNSAIKRGPGKCLSPEDK